MGKNPLSEKDIDCYFRANAGSLVINSKHQVLAFERSGKPGAWQFPQGGVDAGEDLLLTAQRELKEETGLEVGKDYRFLSELPEWIGYELPPEWRNRKTGRGQVQRWFLFQVLDDDLNIDLSKAEDKEFQDWKWMDMEQMLDIVIPFRQAVYRRLGEWLKRMDV